MSEENISLIELLNLAIATPHGGVVNFRALHALFHAVLRLLDIREMKTPWRDAPPPGDGLSDALVGVTAPKQDHQHHHTEEKRHRIQRDITTLEQEIPPGFELQLRIASSSSSSSSPNPNPSPGLAAASIPTSEDVVSKAMKLIEELRNQQDKLKEELKELHNQKDNQQKVDAEMVSNFDKCCHRLDALEDAVKSLRDKFQEYPDPEELSQCVTWDVMQSVLLSEREDLQRELVSAGVVDPATAVIATAPSHSSPPSSPHPVDDTVRPAAPPSPTISEQISVDAHTATEAPSVLSEPIQQTKTGLTAAGMPLTQRGRGSECYPETTEALRVIGKLTEKFSKLEVRVLSLEEGMVDQLELTHLRELITKESSSDALNDLMDQVNQLRSLIDSLMSDREKLDSLEDKFMNLTSQDREATSEAASGSKELRESMSDLRISVQKLEEDMKQLKDKQALTVAGTTDRDLQDQLDHLRGKMEDVISQLLLFQNYEQLQDSVNSLLQQQTGATEGQLKDRENAELVSDVKEAIVQLQADCEKLHETTRCLHDDNGQKQSHIEELFKTTEELQESLLWIEQERVRQEKADKSDKVSSLQFDSAIEQLYAMFNEVLNKVTGQEQDWHKVIDRISTEMECKLNRIELDSVKKQLEDRWKSIHKKLQAQAAPEHDGAAGIRKQLVDGFHCLSCDRPVVMNTMGQRVVKMPSPSGFPSRKSINPKQIFKMTDYNYRPGSRNSGGSHTVTSAGQRRSSLQHMKHHIPSEVDGVIESEVDILGQDGHIYKGRLYSPTIRDTETKLPTISTKDGMGKTKDKVRRSLSITPAASPEVHRSHSAKSAQYSRSASSSSGRDWPVSALGCTSRSSITPGSAAAESNIEPHADETLNL